MERKMMVVGLGGLVTISVLSGFGCFRDLFSIEKAILLAGLFEFLRITCIISMIEHSWKESALAIPLYAAISFVCAASALVGLTSETIEAENRALKGYNTELDRRVRIVQATYSKRIDRELSSIKEKIDFCKIRLAKNPNDSYFRQRLNQRKEEYDKLLAEREEFLSEEITDKEKWIKSRSAILNIEFEQINQEFKGTSATMQAVEKIFRVSQSTAKTVLSVFVICVVEIGIILLSLIVKRGDPNRELKKKYGTKAAKSFLKTVQEFRRKNGRKPYTNELSKKQRQMRKDIVGQ